MELWERLKDAKKPIVLYGMGNGADRILDFLNNMGIAVDGIFASDGFVRHQKFRGFTVQSYAELKGQFDEMIVLLAFGTQRPEVLENIKRISMEQELYVPDVPVVGDTFFTKSFLQQHRNELEAVYSMLSDDRSKEVFEKIVLGKLTGDPCYLWAAEDDEEQSDRVLTFSDDEVFLDLGAYTGDTALKFIRQHPRYERIIAVEPDIKNFKKCKENLKIYKNVEVVNACIDEHCGERFFLMDGGRKSVALDQGGLAVPSINVDTLLNGNRVSYIKMDVEGMEKAALIGAQKTIAEFRPKMLISAYHRSEDLFELPLLVKKFAGEFKLHLRHLSYLPAWDTNFYFNLSADDA